MDNLLPLQGHPLLPLTLKRKRGDGEGIVVDMGIITTIVVPVKGIIRRMLPLLILLRRLPERMLLLLIIYPQNNHLGPDRSHHLLQLLGRIHCLRLEKKLRLLIFQNRMERLMVTKHPLKGPRRKRTSKRKACLVLIRIQTTTVNHRQLRNSLLRYFRSSGRTRLILYLCLSYWMRMCHSNLLSLDHLLLIVEPNKEVVLVAAAVAVMVSAIV